MRFNYKRELYLVSYIGDSVPGSTFDSLAGEAGAPDTQMEMPDTQMEMPFTQMEMPFTQMETPYFNTVSRKSGLFVALEGE